MPRPPHLEAPGRWRRTTAAPASRVATVAVAVAATLVAGCASRPGPRALQPGQDEAAVRAAMGEPGARHPLPGGAQRLEYAAGTYGRRTWMIDLDAQGRVRSVVQALQVDNFAQIKPGATPDAVRRLLGRPAQVQPEHGGRVTWSWRYENPFCLWAQATFSAEGRLMDGITTGPDPLCTPDV